MYFDHIHLILSMPLSFPYHLILSLSLCLCFSLSPPCSFPLSHPALTLQFCFLTTVRTVDCPGVCLVHQEAQHKKELTFSHPSAIKYQQVLSSWGGTSLPSFLLHSGILSVLSLYRVCAYCHYCYGSICASLLLCLGNTVSLKLSKTSASYRLSTLS